MKISRKEDKNQGYFALEYSGLRQGVSEAPDLSEPAKEYKRQPNFFEALEIESKNLVVVIDIPVGNCPPNVTCIGPTRIDYSMLPYEYRTKDIEKKLLDRWKANDLAAYYQSIKRRGRR